MLTQLLAYDNRFTPQENLWMKENPVVTYVGDPSWLPYEGYDDQGNYVGLVPDLLTLASNNTPLTFKHIDTKTWSESLQKVASNAVMMISQSRYSNRDTNLLFSDTYLQNPMVIVMQKGEKYVASLHQISEQKIGVLNNNTTTPALKKRFSNIPFILVENTESGLTQVATGKIDAFICSLPRAGYFIAKNQFNNLRIVGKTELKTELGIGINQHHPILLSIMNKLIKNTTEASIQATLSKWSRQKYVPVPDYTALYTAIGIFSIIIIMGTLFFLRLRYESQARIASQNMMLQQQSKMAAMGEMMDAVAHQWKQPLNALSMYSDLMKSDFEAGNVDKDYVDDMLNGVQLQINHMTTTLSEFRNFFRPNSDVVNFNLKAIIEATLFLVKDEFMKHNINIETAIDDTITLHGNENEFKHLILNIINNAKDAFNSNHIQSRLIHISAQKVDELTEIEIVDNAGGIPEHIISKIFEANVTTKAVGKGTGIGLYMSQQIVGKMRGNIRVENSNGGAKFIISI